MNFECEILISNLVALTMGLMLLFLWYWKYIEERHMDIEDLQVEMMEFRKKLRDMSSQRNKKREELYEYLYQIDQVKKQEALADFEVLPPMPSTDEDFSMENPGCSN